MHLFSHIDYVLLENRACLMHFCVSTILHYTWSRKTLSVCWVKLSLGHYTKLVISVFSPFAWCSRGASLLSTNKTKTLSRPQVSQAILGVLEMLFRMSPKSFRLITSFFFSQTLEKSYWVYGFTLFPEHHISRTLGSWCWRVLLGLHYDFSVTKPLWITCRPGLPSSALPSCCHFCGEVLESWQKED